MTLQIQSHYRLLATIALFLCAAACLPSFAGDRPSNEKPSTTVKFGDLDLNTDAGRRELLTRLEQGAERVCRKEALAFVAVPHLYSVCYRATLAAAVDKIPHAQLSALFAATSDAKKR